MDNGSEFILKLNGIKLPAEVEKQIAAELQSTLMSALGRVDLKAGVGIRFPKEWFGIWLEKLDKLSGPGLPVLRVNAIKG
jgi:hypothetical protein